MRSEWSIVKLSECAIFQEGYVNPSQMYPEYFDGKIKWLRAIDLNDGYIENTTRTLTEKGFSSAGKSALLFKPGSLAISKSGTIGRIGILKDYMCGNRAVINITVYKTYSNIFIFYILKFKRSIIEELAIGSVQKNLYTSSLGKLEFKLPPLPIQKKIAHILLTLDDRIELNRKMNQTLEAMAQALFKSWFVDFDPVHVKLTCKSEEALKIAAKKLGISKEILDLFPNELEESELGMIPKGWSVKKLGECELEIESGTRPKGGIDKELSFGTPSVGAESIAPIGIFDFSNVKYVTNEFAAKAKRGWVQNMDVALYKDGGKPGIFMPRIGLYGNGYPFARFMINEHVFLLRSLSLGQYYLFQLISSKGILDQLIARGSAKAAQPGLNQVEVNDSKFVSPSKELLSAFNKTIEPFVAKQLENGKQIQILQKTRDILLPLLLSGKIDVSEFKI